MLGKTMCKAGLLFCLLLLVQFLAIPQVMAASIASGSFVDDETLRELTVSANVDTIESRAFVNCPNLSMLVCTLMDVEIEEGAFENVENLQVMCYSGSTIGAYARAHGIPCRFIDGFEVSCDTVKNGCVGLPIQWTVTDLFPGENDLSGLNCRLTCGGKIVREWPLAESRTMSFTPGTAGQYRLAVVSRGAYRVTELCAGEVKVAAKLNMGTYEQDRNKNTADPVQWKILAVEDGKALVISEKILRNASYFNPAWIKYKYTYWSGSYVGETAVNWRGSAPESDERKYTGITPTSIPMENGSRGTESDLYPLHARYWCHEVFYRNAFTDEEKARILLTHNTNEDNPEYHVEGGPDTDDYVFFLSYNELLKYMPREADRTAALTAQAQYELGSGKPTYWWLRTPGKFRVNAIYVYAASGKVSLYGSDVGHKDLGYRPAMWITIGG